jgi:hypothetical protein
VVLVVGASAPAAAAAVVLNEVNCEATDWVELANGAAVPVDVGGWLLTDDPVDGVRADHRYVFPAGTQVAAGGRLVVERGAAGFPFGVKCGEDTLTLADPAADVVDAVSVPVLADPANTWGRLPGPQGPWQETRPTRGEPNAAPEPPPPPADPSVLFDPSAVHTIDLGLTDEARARLEADPETYVPATFAVTTPAGRSATLDVGLRLKGSQGSFRPLGGKAAFKLRFDAVVPGQRFAGLRRLTLNNMVQDPSMLHETLAYEVFRAMGVPAPRTGFASVQVNGEDYGLHLNVETLDEVALARWSATTRHLYEAEPLADVVAQDLGRFEVDVGPEDDRADLAALAASLAGGGFPPDTLADAAEMSRMWAVERYVGHLDGYSGLAPNNYYLHADPAGRFTMLPWGTDQTWGVRLGFGGGTPSRLFLACEADAGCRARYAAAVAAVTDRVRDLDLPARVTALDAVVAPWRAADPRRESTVEEVEASVAALRAFLAARPADAAAWLAAQAVAGPGPLPGPVPPSLPAPPVAAAAATSAPAAGTPAAPRRLFRLLARRPGAAALLTGVQALVAGTLRQRGRIELAGRAVTVCRATRRLVAGEQATVRCPLSLTARRAAARRPLALRLITTFEAPGGAVDRREVVLRLPSTRAAAGRSGRRPMVW